MLGAVPPIQHRYRSLRFELAFVSGSLEKNTELADRLPTWPNDQVYQASADNCHRIRFPCLKALKFTSTLKNLCMPVMIEMWRAAAVKIQRAKGSSGY